MKIEKRDKVERLLIIVSIIILMTSPLYVTMTSSLHLTNTILNAENQNTITKYYSFEKPTINEIIIKGESFNTINISDLSLTSNVGSPRIPVKPIRLLLPDDHEVESISVDGTKHILTGSYHIEPAQEPVPISDIYKEETTSVKTDKQLPKPINYDIHIKSEKTQDSNLYKNDENIIDTVTGDNPVDVPKKSVQVQQGIRNVEPSIYESLDPYPGVLYNDGGIQMFRGYAILTVNLYPVQYIPKKGTLLYYSDLTLTVKTKIKENPEQQTLYRGIVSDQQQVSKLVDNPEMVSSYHQLSPTKLYGVSSLVNPADSYQYVIITTNALKNATGAYTFQDLRDHHISKGMSATIVTVEDIYANYDGYDHQEKIRNFIRDAYMNWETEYVLLGGDVQNFASPVGNMSAQVPNLCVGDYYSYKKGLVLTYPDETLSLTGGTYYDGMSVMNTRNSSNIAMASSNNNIFVVGENPDIYDGGTGVYLKFDNPYIQPDIEYMSNQWYFGGSNYDATDPDTGADGSYVGNVFMIKWNATGNSDIYFIGSLNDATTWDGNSYVADTTSNEMYPAIYVQGTTFYVAYVDATAGNVVYTASTDGNTWTSPIKVNSGTSVVAEPGCVDIDSSGITWVDNRYGTKDIYCYSFTTHTEYRVTSSIKNEYRPQLAHDSSGRILLGYTEVNTAGVDTDVCLTYSTNNGATWSTFTTPWSAEAGIQIGPNIIFNTQTNAFYGTYADSTNIYTRLFKLIDVLDPNSCTMNAWWMNNQYSATDAAITDWTSTYAYNTTQGGVPARSLYVNGTYMPSDLYYSCLDGTFNSDGDSNFGEPTDGPGGTDVDLYAEVYVGRAPVDNATDVSNFVRKTITYDNTPLNDPYLKEVLMGGEYLEFGGAADWGGNHMDELVDGSTNHGYTTAGIPSSVFNITKLYDRDGIMIPKTYSIPRSYIVDPTKFLFGFALVDDNWLGTDDSIQKAGAYLDDIKVIDGSTVVFSDDMESGNGKWTMYSLYSGGVNEWELGTPVLNPDVYGGIPHSGNKCWATDLDNTYDNLHAGIIQNKNYIDVSGTSSTIDINLYWWYCTEYRTGTADRLQLWFYDGASTWYHYSGVSGCSGWLTSSLTDKMNAGLHMIQHLGHANEQYVMKIGIPDVQGLTNTKYFFVYSQGCYAGCFDNDGLSYKGDCIAEKFVNSEHGAFAVIMNARYGYGEWNSTDGCSQRYQREFVDAIYGENLPELGRANADSKHDNIYRIDESVMRWVCYETNLLGDPALAIKTPLVSGKLYVADLLARWNFVSLPFNQTVDKTNFRVKYNGSEYSWQEAVNQSIVLGFIYTWNRTYQNYELTDVFVPGEGYWMYAYNDCELQASGISGLVKDNYITNLLPKWNIMGVPNGEPVEKQNLTILNNETVYTWQEAVTNNIILGFIYEWNETNQNYGLTDTLQPGKSYWMYAYHNCALLRPMI